MWLYVFQAVEYEKTFNGIPVEVEENFDSVSGLGIVSNNSLYVDITLSGTKSNIDSITAEDIRAFVDLTDVTEADVYSRTIELEVPEIKDGTVVIKAITREAGSRTKIAVAARVEGVDPVGACIGNRGMRINTIVSEIGGEKIDVVKYSEQPEEFIKAALSPATVNEVIVDGERSCQVFVNNDQLSLAIGKEGQNARLAAKLTGFKIDIKTN